MIKIILKDMYDGVANVLIKFAESAGTIQDVLEDFLEIAGDSLSDESSVLAARRLYTYLKRIGYPVELNSTERGINNFTVDLASGNIESATDIGEPVRLPTPDEIPMESPTPEVSPELITGENLVTSPPVEILPTSSASTPVSGEPVSSNGVLTEEEAATLARINLGA